MPESPNQDSSRQRRANWVGLRTMRQLPKAVGETAGGEPIYEVRSVRLLLDGTAANFVRLTECSRCGKELPGAPVLTTADLDRPLRPMICTACIRSAGVSTVWESEGTEPAGERPTPAPAPAGTPPDLQPARSDGKQPARLDAMEGHLRAVTERVNELGRVARAHQAGIKERTQREEANASALRHELAALRASTEDTRAELQSLAAAQAGTAQLRDEVAQLARLVEAQRGEVVEFVAAVSETQMATSKLNVAQEALAEAIAQFDPSKVEGMITARLADAESRLAEAVARPPAEVDLSKVEELITTRMAEVEGRLAHLVAGQWGDLETAIEGSVKAYMAGFVRAHEELAGGQAVLEERIEALAGQAAQASRRFETLLDRLATLEAVVLQAPVPPGDAAADLKHVPVGSFLDSLDRQLEAAARRLAARSHASRGEP